MRGGPLWFKEQHCVIAHATSAPEDGFDRRVQRLDDPEADRMMAIGGDAVDVVDERVAELLHLGQPLPAQRLQPAEEKPRDAVPGRVGPEADDTGWSGAKWDRVFQRPGRRADRPPNSGPRRRPGITSNRCTQVGEQPIFLTLPSELAVFERPRKRPQIVHDIDAGQRHQFLIHPAFPDDGTAPEIQLRGD